MTNANNHSDCSTARRRILMALHLSVLAASALLILVISWDTFHNLTFTADPFYRKIQYRICLFFQFDIAVEWAMSRHKLRYLWKNLLFIAVSIPYASVIHRLGLEVPPPVQYALRFMPLLRAAYVLWLVSGSLTSNKITSLFAAYITLLLTSLYFGSLMFFIEERTVNPGVTCYLDALWWGIMDMTTCGSSINEMTPTGQILGVLLAAEGLVLFPVFTVYITAAFARAPQAKRPDTQ
ncbi:MAG: potassium channel family protein [Muribaculaceae bacterium]|nr:potassium channel family protein [Muribaculaceae bacterium]